MFLFGSVFPCPGLQLRDSSSNTVIKMSVAECTARLMNAEITLGIHSALPREMDERVQRQHGHQHTVSRKLFETLNERQQNARLAQQ